MQPRQKLQPYSFKTAKLRHELCLLLRGGVLIAGCFARVAPSLAIALAADKAAKAPGHTLNAERETD